MFGFPMAIGITPEQIVRRRYYWFQEAERLRNVSPAGKHLGISRKTFYKWRRRFKEARGDPDSLLDHPRRPYRSPRRINEGNGQAHHKAAQEDPSGALEALGPA